MTNTSDRPNNNHAGVKRMRLNRNDSDLEDIATEDTKMDEKGVQKTIPPKQYAEYANLNQTRDRTSKIWQPTVRCDKNPKLILHLDHLETRLIEYILQDHVKYVLVCTAWLTNYRILEALAAKDGCVCIVQSEKFGKQDEDGFGSDRLKKAYDALKPLSLLGGTFGEPLCEAVPAYRMLAGTAKIAQPYAVRSAGVDRVNDVANSETNPKMHHKFAIFLNDQGIPVGVWNGSFNWSNCAKKSYENAMYIQDVAISRALFAEFVQILRQSKELTWK